MLRRTRSRTEWQTGCMSGHTPHGDVDPVIEAAVAVLSGCGALFGYLHGSRADGSARPGSDIDLAAYFAEPVPAAFDVPLPARVDLVVLNHAPLELRGRIALHGRLLFEGDPQPRVDWEAMTRKIYLDELPRITRSHREFLEAVSRG